MPTLSEAQKKIGELVVAKGFGNNPDDFANKLLFAFIELGEAGDNWKKGVKKFPDWESYAKATTEELVDVIFYILDAARVAFPEIDMDEMFEYKWNKNMNRPHRYGEGFTKLEDVTPEFKPTAVEADELHKKALQ
jgi:NTP pyrophosphatase (non-canonical NTP hydrolase)